MTMAKLKVPPGTTYVQTPHGVYPIGEDQCIEIHESHPDFQVLLGLGFSVPEEKKKPSRGQEAASEPAGA